MLTQNFKIRFENDNVTQFEGIGYIDVIIASRPLSLEMLTESIIGFENMKIARAEAVIGLKIQAYKNDPTREYKDKADIQELLLKNDLDLDIVKKYAEVFNEWPTIQKILQNKK